MDAKSTAVVLIEYQNDFTSEGGTLLFSRPMTHGEFLSTLKGGQAV